MASVAQTMRFRFALGLTGSLLLVGVTSLGQPSDAVRQRARDRFDVAMKLFNEGNNAGALAEFQRAYDLSPNPVVLYNIGLVYAAMGQPVQAVDALEKVLAESEKLSKDDRGRAIQVFKEQSRRIGELSLEGVPKSSVVEVDGVEVGRTPLPKPLRVSSGTVVVTVIAEGYHPSTQSVTVAGDERRQLVFEMVPLERKSAWLDLDTNLLDAEILLDGTVVGHTPDVKALSVTPGPHRVELRRAGYRTAMASTQVAEGTRYKVRLTAEPEQGQLNDDNSGSLRLSSSESETSFSVDGRPMPGTPSWSRLPTGRHLIVAQRTGFFPERRVVQLPRSENLEFALTLHPTPQTYDAYVASAKRQRYWAVGAMGTGILVGAAGGIFWHLNDKKLDDAQKAYDEIVYASVEHSGRSCDVFDPNVDRAACESLLDSRWNDLQDRKKDRVIAYVTTGVGAALIATGVVLYVLSDSPSKYDRPQASARLRPGLMLDRDTQGLAIEGGF